MKINNLKIDLNSGIISVDNVEIPDLKSIIEFFSELIEKENNPFPSEPYDGTDRMNEISELKPGTEIEFLTESGTVERTVIGIINIPFNGSINYPSFIVVNFENDKSLKLGEIKDIRICYKDDWFLTWEEIEELIEKNKIYLVPINDFLKIVE